MEDGVDFVTELGSAMTAHRLRRLGEQLLEGYMNEAFPQLRQRTPAIFQRLFIEAQGFTPHTRNV